MNSIFGRGKAVAWLVSLLLLGGIPFTLLYTAKTKSPTAVLYEAKCANCHMAQGEGLERLIPPLRGSAYLANTESLACIIKYGLRQGQSKPADDALYRYPMPPNPEFTETQIANLINYIRNNWGNSYDYVSPEAVKKYLQSCEDKP